MKYNEMIFCEIKFQKILCLVSWSGGRGAWSRAGEQPAKLEFLELEQKHLSQRQTTVSGCISTVGVLSCFEQNCSDGGGDICLV